MYYPRTRKEAIINNWPKYMTWKPCKRNHLDSRYTSTGQCETCQKENTTKWKKDNSSWFPEHTRKYARKRHWEKRDELIKKTKEWRLKNPEKQKELNRKWNERNPEAKRIYENKRRSKLREAAGSHTIKQIRNMMINQECECIYCKINIEHKYHVDHIIPISRGGCNDISNIQLLCVDCNQSKHNKMPDVWLLEFNSKKETKK